MILNDSCNLRSGLLKPFEVVCLYYIKGETMHVSAIWFCCLSIKLYFDFSLISLSLIFNCAFISFLSYQMGRSCNVSLYLFYVLYVVVYLCNVFRGSTRYWRKTLITLCFCLKSTQISSESSQNITKGETEVACLSYIKGGHVCLYYMVLLFVP